MKVRSFVFILGTLFQGQFLRAKFRINAAEGDTLSSIHEKYEKSLVPALLSTIDGIPKASLAVVFDNNTGFIICNQLYRTIYKTTAVSQKSNKTYLAVDLIQELMGALLQNDISTYLFNITTAELQNKYFSFLSKASDEYVEATTLFVCTHKLAEHLLIELYYRNLMGRNFLNIFYWGERPISRYFIRSVHEIMKVVVITHPRSNAYRIYFNQATSNKKHHLELVNWWTAEGGLFRHPTLPDPKNVFRNFNGKVFDVPVLHKPPWHFVKFYENNTIEVLGGRDDMLLSLLSERLNFKFKYFDPPERSQGSSILADGSFEGVLGLIGKRDAEFFVGDVTLTHERLMVVEFSFLTVADSVAFVTHAPRHLTEALALVRPFHWQVWPAIVATIVASGPILYFLIALPNMWQPRFLVRSHSRLFYDCCWFTTTLFLKQTGKQPSNSHKSRLFIIILSVAATYIIADMYSANLTSLLARPGKEKSMNNLIDLEYAMITKRYKLYVEKYSSSYGLLENGTGVYGRLWNMMRKKQTSFVINSVEDGVQLVRHSNNIAVLGGRETLYFDIQRFGTLR